MSLLRLWLALLPQREWRECLHSDKLRRVLARLGSDSFRSEAKCVKCLECDWRVSVHPPQSELHMRLRLQCNARTARPLLMLLRRKVWSREPGVGNGPRPLSDKYYMRLCNPITVANYSHFDVEWPWQATCMQVDSRPRGRVGVGASSRLALHNWWQIEIMLMQTH